MLPAPPVPEGGAVRGIVLMVLAAALFSCLDATAKYLGQTMNSLDVVWLRYITHVLLLALFLRVWSHREAFLTDRPWLHALRGCHLLGATIFNFWALQYLQLAEASAIMFSAPLIVTALAGPLLGEAVGLRRWAAVAVGFVGVLVVTRPGTSAMHWAVILSFCSVVNYALYSILTRRMGGTESTQSMLMLSTLVGATALSPLAVSAISSLAGWHWVLAFMLGAFGAVGHYALVIAHKLTSASQLAPFIYTQMIWMILLGYIFFGDTPDLLTLVGTAIIAASGLYILHRERVRGAQLVSPDPNIQ
ncbi:MAG: DMT family transporter [Pseudomonadota bacterium]